MRKHLPLLLIGGFCALFLGAHSAVSRYLMQGDYLSDRAPMSTDKPDFTAFSSVAERKQAFFGFMEDYVLQRNQELRQLRQRIAADKLSDGELLELAQRYRVKSDDPAEIRRRLLLKVDALPPSLVLAQGAIESAWGTSRFAVEGNNYFGQWCFSPGCGLVPAARQQGKAHEVRVFEDPAASVKSYMRNLNSHPAYVSLRQARAELRAQGAPLNGCYLATGLGKYSEKGEVYIEALKRMIRVNDLETDPQGYCAPVMLADEEPSAPEQSPSAAVGDNADDPQEMAADESQQESSPASSQPVPSG
ncbi:MAG: glucosaminidase domain-containing protein [Pseudomonadota bacterium]|nr:glucosaminidase domain-containing protein [Pseudomonadota bacterium]